MSRMKLDTRRINLSREAVAAANSIDVADVEILVKIGGQEGKLPPAVEAVLLDVIKSMAANQAVQIGRIPDELTSTAAAQLLGVSRPTLMKWHTDGAIAGHKVGSHTRFKRKDVLAFRARRANEQIRAFEALRNLDLEEMDAFDDFT